MIRPTFFVVLVALSLSLTYAQPQRNEGDDRRLFQPLQPNSPGFRRRRNTPCVSPFRSIDGTCTNPFSSTTKPFGSTNLAHFSYFPGRSSTVPGGSDLKSAREISNILFRSCDDVFDPRFLSEMATFFGQFVDHNVVSTPSSSERFNIPVPANDPVFGNATGPSCGEECVSDVEIEPRRELTFFRSQRVRVSANGAAELPENSLTSALDLVAVYGPNELRNTDLRAGTDGLLKVLEVPGRRSLLPLNTVGLNNAPDSNSPNFFLAGDHRANEHGVLLALHTIFVREHNSIAAELKETLGWTDDDQIYENARQINGAQFQKIIYQEWLPAITGNAPSRYRGFKQRVNLAVSVLFSTAAFRVGHTLVGNNLSLRGAGNAFMAPISFCQMFFKMASSFMESNMLDNVMRGALQTRAQKVDIQVRDSLRNFLFENVNGEEGFDLVALNLQRARDNNLPTYNEVRRRFRLRPAERFSDITNDPVVQSNLMTAYEVVDNVEAWPGMLAEDLAQGSSLTPTLLTIWRTEFNRLRDGDSFYYENRRRPFSQELMDNIPRVSELFDVSVNTFKEIVLRNTDIAAADLPERMFMVDQ